MDAREHHNTRNFALARVTPRHKRRRKAMRPSARYAHNLRRAASPLNNPVEKSSTASLVSYQPIVIIADGAPSSESLEYTTIVYYVDYSIMYYSRKPSSESLESPPRMPCLSLSDSAASTIDT